MNLAVLTTTENTLLFQYCGFNIVSYLISTDNLNDGSRRLDHRIGFILDLIANVNNSFYDLFAHTFISSMNDSAYVLSSLKMYISNIKVVCSNFMTNGEGR